MRADIVPGGVFPDYALPDHTGTVRTLGELQGSDPLVLTLARGHYCPKEHQQHLDLAAAQPKFAVAYTRLVTISTDNLLETNEFRSGVGAHWPFLSDPGRKLQKDLETFFEENMPELPEGTEREPQQTAAFWRALQRAAMHVQSSGKEFIDGGNLLEFSKPLSRSPGETALYGRHLGDEAVPLGSFDDVRADTCSWDKAMLACVGDKDFEVQRFAR